MIELLSRAFGPWVRLIDKQSLRADAFAGILGALLVLPQGIAFASLAGLPPEYGLYTAIVPCVIAALFGSSWHVVSGPTNANSLALFATLAPLAAVGSPAYIQLALAVTVLVGVMQWLIGALRIGAVANFISPSALHGFTSGAAALIALHEQEEWDRRQHGVAHHRIRLQHREVEDHRAERDEAGRKRHGAEREGDREADEDRAEQDDERDDAYPFRGHWTTLRAVALRCNSHLGRPGVLA